MNNVYCISTTSKLKWTNKILPQDTDKTWKRIAKFALVILSLGTIFLVTMTMDLTNNIYKWLTLKKPAEPTPPTVGDKIIGASLATVNGLISGILTPFIPTMHASQVPNSFNKFGFISAYVGTTSALLGYLISPRAAYATLVAHTTIFLIRPITDYFWSKKDTSEA